MTARSPRARPARRAPTISCSTRPVGLTAAGASSAATSVGAMSISAGGVSKGFTFGPTATIVPSMRWSPLTQSASSIRGLRVRQRVALGGHHQDVRSGVGVLALEDLFALVDLLDRLLAGLRDRRSVPRRSSSCVAHLVEVAGVDDTVDLAAGQVDRHALAGGADRRVRLGLRPVDRLRQRDLPVQTERVVDLARDLAHRPPLHRAEHRVGGTEVEVPELLQHAVHVDRARARLEPVVGDEQDDVVGTRARDERADRLVGLLEDVGHLLADARVLVLDVVGMVGRDVVGQRVLGAVDQTQTLAIRSHSVLSISHSLTLMRLAVTS